MGANIWSVELRGEMDCPTFLWKSSTLFSLVISRHYIWWQSMLSNIQNSICQYAIYIFISQHVECRAQRRQGLSHTLLWFFFGYIKTLYLLTVNVVKHSTQYMPILTILLKVIIFFFSHIETFYLMTWHSTQSICHLHMYSRS